MAHAEGPDRLTIVRGLLLITAAVAFSAAAAAPASAADWEIGSSAEAYAPPYLRVGAGDHVTWSPSPLHPLKFDSDPAGTPEQTVTPYRREFTSPGVYDFYCTNHGGPDRAGMAGRLVVGNANEPPDARLAPSAQTVAAGTAVTFDAGGSTDPEGDAFGYDWDLDGDGTFELLEGGPVRSRSWPGVGTHVVGVRVRDVHGGEDVARRAVRVVEAGPAPPSTADPSPGGGSGGGEPGSGAAPGAAPGGPGPPPPDDLAPLLRLDRSSTSLRSLRARGLVVTLSASEALTATVRATVTVGGRSSRLPAISRRIPAGARTTLVISLPRVVRGRLARARRARVLLSVKGVDGAGNAARAERRFTAR